MTLTATVTGVAIGCDMTLTATVTGVAIGCDMTLTATVTVTLVAIGCDMTLTATVTGVATHAGPFCLPVSHCELAEVLLHIYYHSAGLWFLSWPKLLVT
jgi:hypothetical protein